MTASDNTFEGGQGQPGRGDAPRRGDTSPADWRERAAFQVSIHSAPAPDGGTAWETRAYHEESDTASAWPGPPGAALLSWLLAVAELSPGDTQRADAPAHAAPQPPAPQVEPPHADAPQPAPAEEVEPADDFAQIIGMSAAVAERLQRAGITTYARLAASTPAALAALLDMPAERIARRGWITRARALARLAAIPPAPKPPAAEADPLSVPEALGAALGDEAGPRRLETPAHAALHVEVLFDDQGGILEQRLLREGDPAGPGSTWEGGHTARIFIDPAAALGELGTSLPGGLPGEVEVALDELALEELPGAQLRARSTLRLAGLGAEHLLSEQPAYLAYVLAHELESDATAVLKAVAGRLGPEAREESIELAFAMPEIGRYQMLLVALVADGAALSAAAGPRLRVDP